MAIAIPGCNDSLCDIFLVFWKVTQHPYKLRSCPILSPPPLLFSLYHARQPDRPNHLTSMAWYALLCSPTWWKIWVWLWEEWWYVTSEVGILQPLSPSPAQFLPGKARCCFVSNPMEGTHGVGAEVLFMNLMNEPEYRPYSPGQTSRWL